MTPITQTPPEHVEVWVYRNGRRSNQPMRYDKEIGWQRKNHRNEWEHYRIVYSGMVWEFLDPTETDDENYFYISAGATIRPCKLLRKIDEDQYAIRPGGWSEGEKIIRGYALLTMDEVENVNAGKNGKHRAIWRIKPSEERG